MKVALVQPSADIIPSIDGAVDQLYKILIDCKENKVDIAVFPELYLTGYHLPNGLESFSSLGQKIEGPIIQVNFEIMRLLNNLLITKTNRFRK